jgi:hypothetical protein
MSTAALGPDEPHRYPVAAPDQDPAFAPPRPGGEPPGRWWGPVLWRSTIPPAITLQYLVGPWGETPVQRDRSALDMLGIRRSANMLTYSASLTPYSASRPDSFALKARTTSRRA